MGIAVADVEVVALGVVAASLNALFAVIVLKDGHCRAGNVSLAAFLGLVAANAVAGAVQTQMPAGSPAQLAWFRVATAFAALDPLFLFAFAAAHAGRGRLREPLPLGLVAAASAALALLAVQARIEDHAYHAALGLFTACVYGVVLAVAVLALARGRVQPGLHLLAAGLCIAAIPPWARFSERVLDLAGVRSGTTSLAVYALPALATAAVALAARAAPGAGSRRALLAGAAAGLGLTLLVFSELATFLATPPRWVDLAVAGGGPLRWLLFAVLASAAVIRHSYLGMGLASRRAAARMVVAMGFGLAAAAGLVVGQGVVGGDVGLRPLEVAVLLLAMASSQGFRRLVDGAAHHVYGVPPAADLAASLEAYRAAVAEARHEPGSPGGEQRLRRLREELGLDARTASVVERMAASADGPVRAGALVAGRYRVARLLGRGSSGRTYLARDELLERDVALKEVPWDEPAEEEAIVREARLAGSLSHPHVVGVHDLLRLRSSVVIVSEFVPGGSLEARLAAGPLGQADAVRVVDGVLAGLASVHGRGIVHRDLKPANVLLDAAGAAKVADFGTASVRRGETAAAGVLVGTPEFMSPEQRRGEPASPASDIYAAGLLLAACLGPSPSPALAAVAERAKREDPGERFPSAEAMRAALSAAGQAA